MTTALQPDLNTAWFLLIGLLFGGFVLLDGFDLGVGVLHLLAGKEEHRRTLLAAVGPFWDGNEVWLVAGGAALFAAFPPVYATVFSGFYLAVMLLLLALILRAVSIEFRSAVNSPIWRSAWDAGFAVGSALVALLLGVALGNIARGLPLDAEHTFTGSFLGLLNPYALVIGLTAVAVLTMHGAAYLLVKTDGEVREASHGWIRVAWAAALIMLAQATALTWWLVPRLTQPFRDAPVLLAVPLLGLLALLAVGREAQAHRGGRAFAASCMVIVALMLTFGLGMYPTMVPSAPDAANSLTIYNGSSSQTTLRIMGIIALVGLPLVMAYSAGVFHLFRGKVRPDESTY